MRVVAALVLLALMGACQMVPKDGPTGRSIMKTADVAVGQTTPSVSYAVVDLSRPAIEAANKSTLAKTPLFSRAFGDRARAADVRIGIGDIITVTIFEASAGGLFIPLEAGSRAGNFVQVPSQQVDAAGKITMPYAGSIRVAGRTARDVSDEITQLLRNRAVDPQVIVSIAERRSNALSVLGEVNSPQRFALDPGGLTVLDAIARAGGPRNPAHESLVTIRRGRQTTQAVLSALIRDPSQNVSLLPGDVVFVSRDQKVFLVLGSTPSPGSIGGTNNRRFAFDNDNETLAEAVAKAGGLDSSRAEARSIFVFRHESRNTLASVGVDTAAYVDDLIPTIYRANWSKADGFFLANSFYMRNKDVIYVAEHPTADFNKFTASLRGVTGGAGDLARVLGGN